MIFKMEYEFYIWNMEKQWQIKINKLQLENFTLWKYYEQGASWKKQCCFLIDGAPEIANIKNS